MAKLLIANRFEITDLEKDLLGRGGMGVVYRATDTQSGETVAVKALNAEALANEPAVLERFQREGESLRKLNHPNIVKYIAAVESNGQHYLVMEYIDGGSLQGLLSEQGTLPSQRAIEIGLDLADALVCAHRLGIVYRDLKPANVLLAKDGTPRLTDFGVIQLADSSHLTQTGMLVGTVNYLSPEAINSEPLDFRADIWAFGVLLFEMLTGKLPFTGPNLTARITAIITQPVPDISQYNPNIPKPIADLIYSMLKKDRNQRIPSMRQVGAELESILMSLQGRPTSIESRFKTPIPSNRNTRPDHPTGTVTFLFTDIEGSTKLAQQYPEAMPDLLARHNEILNQTVESHNGFVFQVVGDSYAVSFHNATDALNAALQAQRNFHNENWNPVPVKVRMGIHTGAAQLQVDNKENKYSGYATLALTQRIMSAGHGGQILISSAAENLLRGQLPKDAALRDMGEKNLKDILLPERIYQLNVPDLPSDFASLNTYEKIRHNLPLQRSTFIGREKEVEQIKKRLEKHHLVTLTGSGGIGKTRLSIQVASELLPEYPIGVWLVELAPLTDPALVPQSVCAALGVTPEGNTSALEALINYMRSKKILLVVDNCEHLIDACAQLCDALLHTCPDLWIITSSREALGIEGENAYRVPSLSLPDPKSGLHVIEESEAVKLFMERATALLPEFVLTEANAPVIAQICQRLDGIALAIELAASRVKMLKVEQIATRLDDVFRLLTGGSRTALPRQQTLRALIDWSYALLSDDERTFLRRLSIFMGGWTLEAAEAVCGSVDALDLLSHLVDKSLVAVDQEHGDEARYYLLETVRQYAREKLVESGESETIREQHTRWCVELAERAEPKLRGHGQIEWLDRMEQEHDNLRAALEWSRNNNIDLGLRIANSLIWFWDIRDHAIEGVQHYENLLAVAPLKPSSLHARSFARASWVAMIARNTEQLFAFSQAGMSMSREVGDAEGLAFSIGMAAVQRNFHGDNDQALRLAEESLALSDKAGIKWFKRRILSAVGYISQALGNHERARSAFQESLTLSREDGDLTFITFMFSCLGFLELDQGQYAQALILFQEGLHLAREVKNRNLIAEDFQNMGEVNIILGQYSQAKALLEESLAVDREVGNYRRQALVLRLLGRVARLQDNYENARKLYVESLQLAQRNNLRTTLAWCLVGMAALQNEPQKGVRLLSAADAMPELYSSVYPYERFELENISNTIRAKLDETDFNTEWELGKQMSLDEVVAYASKELQ